MEKILKQAQELRKALWDLKTESGHISVARSASAVVVQNIEHAIEAAAKSGEIQVKPTK